MTARYVLPCGCVVLLDFTHGERLVRCAGGGLTPSNGHVARESLRECKGGVEYCVTAERVPVTRYAARPLTNRGAA